MNVFKKYSFRFKEYNAYMVPYYQDHRRKQGVPHDVDFLPIGRDGSSVILSGEGYGLINPKTGNLVSGSYGNGNIHVDITDLPPLARIRIIDMEACGYLRPVGDPKFSSFVFCPNGELDTPPAQNVSNIVADEKKKSPVLEFVGYAYRNARGETIILDTKMLEDVTKANENELGQNTNKYSSEDSAQAEQE